MSLADPSPRLFPQDYRASGLLLHVTSLPSRYGIGGVGPAALGWVDQLRGAGQSWWQALPLGRTGNGTSPYQPLSSFAGNELLVSPDWPIEERLLRKAESASRDFLRAAADYEAVIPYKRRLLKSAWANFIGETCRDLHAAYEQFRHDLKIYWRGLSSNLTKETNRSAVLSSAAGSTPPPETEVTP